jgi:HEAT repeat protein
MDPFQDRLEAILQECSPEARQGVEQMIRLHLPAGSASFEKTLALCVDPHAEPKARSTACWILGRLKDPTAVPTLVLALGDDDPAVRTQAASSLAAIDDRSAVEPLLETFQQDSDPWVREMAINALWLIGDPAPLEPLIATLRNHGEPAGIRSACAEALGELACAEVLDEPGKQAAMGALIDALQEESPRVRFFAAFALGLLRDPAAIPALQHVAATDDGVDPRHGSVRDEAREAIARIEGRSGTQCDAPGEPD